MGKDITLRPDRGQDSGFTARPLAASICCARRRDMRQIVRYNDAKCRISLRSTAHVHDNAADTNPTALLLAHAALGRCQRLENAGRANSRSAYFISGAACFGIWMP